MSQFFIETASVPPPPTPFVLTLSDNVGTKVNADSTGNIQLEGQLNEQIGFFSTVVATTPAPGSHELMLNPMSPARWIVDGLSTTANPNGTHSTIAAAIASALSGDTILILPKGSPYVEDLILKAGINLVAMGGDGYDSNVTITGNITYNVGGSTVIANINLQTNNNFCLTVSGSAASRLVLKDCVISALNHTAINFTSSNANALIFAEGCFGTININTATLYSQTSAGTLIFEFCSFANAVSSVSSNNSAGIVNWQNSISNVVLTTSGTGVIFIDNCEIDTTTLNTTALTTAGTGTSNIYNSYVAAGTASAISVGAGTTLACGVSAINSSNTNAITGAGTLSIQGISLVSSSGINTTTINGKAFASGSFQALNGTVSLPSYSFISDKTSGIYYASTQVRIANSGGDVIQIGNGFANFQGIANLLALAYGINFQSVIHGTTNLVASNTLYVSCDSSGGAITLNIPTTGLTNGQKFVIKDAKGSAAADNITITTAGGTVTFDGSTSVVMNVNYGSLTIIYNSTTGNYEIN